MSEQTRKQFNVGLNCKLVENGDKRLCLVLTENSRGTHRGTD